MTALASRMYRGSTAADSASADSAGLDDDSRDSRTGNGPKAVL